MGNSESRRQEHQQLLSRVNAIVAESEGRVGKHKTDIFNEISRETVYRVSTLDPALARRVWIAWIHYLEKHPMTPHNPQNRELFRRFIDLGLFLNAHPEQFKHSTKAGKTLRQVWPWLKQMQEDVVHDRETKQETDPVPRVGWNNPALWRPFWMYNNVNPAFEISYYQNMYVPEPGQFV